MHSLRHYPSDWQELKILLRECAIKLWNEHHMSRAIMTLELHLPGKFIRKHRKGGYSLRNIHWRRGVEWTGRLAFNNSTQEITVDNCMFGPNLMSLAADYYAERGIKYRLPSIIPKVHQELESTKSLLIDPSGVRYADYSRRERPPYDFRKKGKQGKKRLYTPSCEGRMYLPAGQRAREEEVAREEVARS